MALRRYWTLDTSEDGRVSFEDAVSETERLLVEAVRLRRIADVPVGALLSGGVDSGLVCWALKELNANVRSFTVGTPGDPDDETSAARATAERLGIVNEVVSLSPEQGAPKEELCNAYGEPIASSSALGVLRVSRAVKGSAKVLLTGDGGDDIYLGYPFFYKAWLAQSLAAKLPKFAGAVLSSMDRALLSVPFSLSRRAWNFLSYSVGGIGSFARVRLGLPYFEQNGLLGNRLSGLRLAHRELPGSIDSGRHLLDDVFEFNRRFHFLSEFMAKVDGATMYHALEARSPFLDHQLWEFAARLPYSVRLHGRRLKAVLREIARRRLGRDVSTRAKQGFTIPAEKWLLARWSSALETLETNSVAAREGWLDSEALPRTLRQAKSTGKTPPQLWHAVVLEHWLRHRGMR